MEKHGPPVLRGRRKVKMTTVTYDVVVHLSIAIDADELIDETARDIISQRVDFDIYDGIVHDVDISAE